MKGYRTTIDIRMPYFKIIPNLKERTYLVPKGTTYAPDVLIQISPYSVNRVKRMVLYEFQWARIRADEIELDDSLLEKLACIFSGIQRAVKESDKLAAELENLINIS